MLALIPCRSGSKRVPRKNFLELVGKPLWRWTYEAAEQSGVFDQIVICTDVPQEFEEVSVLHQPHPLHRDDSRDIEWVTDALKRLIHSNHKDHSVCAPCSLGSYCIPEFSILRVTSPFRDAETIHRAKDHWDTIKGSYDSMRAVRPCSEHPMKQWQYDPQSGELWAWMKASHHQHLHSRPTQELAESWVQTAGLEMAHTMTPLGSGTIAGERIAGFPLDYPASLDINTERDLEEARNMLGECHCLRG